MSQSKPREFWLNERQGRFYKDSDASCPDEEIHVVEASAITQLMEVAEAMAKALYTIANETEMHSSRVGQWSKDVANEALEAFKKAGGK